MNDTNTETKKEKSNILIVTPLLPPEPGGPSYYSVHLKEAFEEMGDKVDVMAFREVRKYPSGVRHLMFLYKVLWRAKSVGAVIILDSVSVAIPSVLACWLLGKRTVVRVGGDFVWERYIERTGDKVLLSQFYDVDCKLTWKEKMLIWLQKYVVLRLATYVIFNTQWQRELWQKPYNLRLERTGVIPNAYTPSTDVHRGGDAFLCAWRPTAFKNIDTLEVAYKKAKERCPDIQLNIYKDIPREELHEHMKSARALVVPSLTELSPNIALEALAMGLPVLLTKDCGAYELLDGVVTWIDPVDTQDIADKMCALMDPDVYREAKDKSRKLLPTQTYKNIAESFYEFIV